MSTTLSFTHPTTWRCAACDQDLQARKVAVSYLHSVFHVELMACPECGFVLVPADLALGRMLEVEQLLEDK